MSPLRRRETAHLVITAQENGPYATIYLFDSAIECGRVGSSGRSLPCDTMSRLLTVRSVSMVGGISKTRYPPAIVRAAVVLSAGRGRTASRLGTRARGRGQQGQHFHHFPKLDEIPLAAFDCSVPPCWRRPARDRRRPGSGCFGPAR